MHFKLRVMIQYEWVKIVDFLIKGHFLSSPVYPFSECNISAGVFMKMEVLSKTSGKMDR